MPRALAETTQFKTDKKRIKRSGRYDWEKMREVVKELMNDRPLPKKHRDHELSGDYAGVRECHTEADWLLIYDKAGSVQTGSLKIRSVLALICAGQRGGQKARLDPHSL